KFESMSPSTVIPSEAKHSGGILRNSGTVMPRNPSALLGMRNRTVVIFLCVLGIVTSAFGEPDLQFNKANQEYAQGHFKEAIADYEALIHVGQWNANLFYDLGNAYFRTRDFGRAILNY